MSRKSEVSLEQKVDIVRRCLKGEWSIEEAGRRARVDKATIRRWISRYEAEGEKALAPHERNRVYREELKQQAVQEYLSGLGSQLEISKKYKLRDTRQLSDWIKMALKYQVSYQQARTWTLRFEELSEAGLLRIGGGNGRRISRRARN